MSFTPKCGRSVPSPNTAEHLGDGAYVLPTNEGFVLLANSGSMAEASDRVYLDDYAATALLRYLIERADKGALRTALIDFGHGTLNEATLTEHEE